jgi:hypothetical protein
MIRRRRNAAGHVKCRKATHGDPPGVLDPFCDVEVVFEIDARFPGGAPDTVVRTITENCRVLKFTSAEFEES